MNASMTEHSNAASIDIGIEEEGEYGKFGITDSDNRETLGQIDYELFHGHAVFNYAPLGESNAEDEEHSDEHVCEDEYA